MKNITYEWEQFARHLHAARPAINDAQRRIAQRLFYAGYVAALRDATEAFYAANSDRNTHLILLDRLRLDCKQFGEHLILQIRMNEQRTYGDTQDCKGCRYWSEMIAKSQGGEVVALCLAQRGRNPAAIFSSEYTASWQTCPAWASGHLGPVDEPGNDAHDKYTVHGGKA